MISLCICERIRCRISQDSQMSHGWRNPPTPLGVTRRLRTFSSPSSSPPLGMANSTHTHPCRELPQASEDHKKTPSKTDTYLGALLATRATKKEYSGELGSQNYSKMEQNMEPVFAHFSETGKRSPTSQHNHSRIWRQNNPQSDPRGSPKEAQIHQKPKQNRL